MPKKQSPNRPDIKLPLVKFEYPSDKRDGALKERLVAVTKKNLRYVEGFEIDFHDGSLDELTRGEYSKVGVFKTYRVNKIASHGISLSEFNP